MFCLRACLYKYFLSLIIKQNLQKCCFNKIYSHIYSDNKVIDLALLGGSQENIRVCKLTKYLQSTYITVKTCLENVCLYDVTGNTFIRYNMNHI